MIIKDNYEAGDIIQFIVIVVAETLVTERLVTGVGTRQCNKVRLSSFKYELSSRVNDNDISTSQCDDIVQLILVSFKIYAITLDGGPLETRR